MAMTSLPVEERARFILEIVPGERPLLPEFGWRGHLMPRIESPVERAVAAVLAENALARWAPDLDIEHVEVSRAGPGEIRMALRVPGRAYELVVRWRGHDGASREHTGRDRHGAQSQTTQA